MELKSKEAIKIEIDEACRLPEGTTVNKFKLLPIIGEIHLAQRHLESAATMISHLEDGQLTPELRESCVEWAQEIQSTIGRFKDTIQRRL